MDKKKKKIIVATGPMKNTQANSPKRIHQVRILGRNVSMIAGSTPKSVYFSSVRNPAVATVRSSKTPQKRQRVGVSTTCYSIKFRVRVMWGACSCAV
jgi:hypothetical protein